jgi:hypothetical protein
LCRRAISELLVTCPHPLRCSSSRLASPERLDIEESVMAFSSASTSTRKPLRLLLISKTLLSVSRSQRAAYLRIY